MKSRTIEIIDNHIKALEEELEWYQKKNIEWQEKCDTLEDNLKDLAKTNLEILSSNAMLRASIASLRDQLRWRDAKLEPPKRSGHYFTKQLGGIIDITYYNYTSTYGWDCDNKITKWLPIPEDGDA